MFRQALPCIYPEILESIFLETVGKQQNEFHLDQLQIKGATLKELQATDLWSFGLVAWKMRNPDLIWPYWAQVKKRGYGVDDFDQGLYEIFETSIEHPPESSKFGDLKKHLDSAKTIMQMCCVPIHQRPTAEALKLNIKG